MRTRTPLSMLSTTARSAVVIAAVAATTASHAVSASAQSSAEQQIAEAVLAAPLADRDAATVLGYGADGSLTTLRHGSNELVCLADNPQREGWEVDCYHSSIEPYMARGRELVAQGVTDAGERQQQRWREADAGTLSMPEEPAILYILTGEAYDPATGEITNPYQRWVLYTPWATPETTGISAQPAAPGAPWLMFAGTAGAHIMIAPPQGGG